MSSDRRGDGPAAVAHTMTAHHWTKAATFDLSGLRRKVKTVEGFNAKLAVVVTHAIGTMACAYVFTGLALFGLPGAIQAGVASLVQWTAQTFLQLVLLSIIMVGQQVQADASDARAEHTDRNTGLIIDRLDGTTEGGIKAVIDATATARQDILDAIAAHLGVATRGGDGS